MGIVEKWQLMERNGVYRFKILGLFVIWHRVIDVGGGVFYDIFETTNRELGDSKVRELNETCRQSDSWKIVE